MDRERRLGGPPGQRGTGGHARDPDLGTLSSSLVPKTSPSRVEIGLGGGEAESGSSAAEPRPEVGCGGDRTSPRQRRLRLGAAGEGWRGSQPPPVQVLRERAIMRTPTRASKLHRNPRGAPLPRNPNWACLLAEGCRLAAQGRGATTATSALSTASADGEAAESP